jgi:uncharacterized membrane protein
MSTAPALALLQLASPRATGAEETVIVLVGWLRLAIEITGAAVIAIGIVLAIVGFVRESFTRRGGEFIPIRLTLGRYLTLALEFQLASDILSTAVAPTWTQIGQLGAIAVIRTTLNFFLTRELREASEATRHERAVASG